MRPDAVRVWKQKEVLSRFKRYFAIINKEKIPRYMITKRVPVSIKLESSVPTEKLWAVHDRTVGIFNTLLQELDAQQDSLSYFNKLDTPQTSFLDLKTELADRILRNCHFCERQCGINREEKKGTCRLKNEAYISSWFHHMGEEAPLIPSGTKN